MIIVSRLNGARLAINADHIERIEETPDTVITLLDGKKILVLDSVMDVIDRVVEYRASVLRISYTTIPEETEPLRLVTDQGLVTDEGLVSDDLTVTHGIVVEESTTGPSRSL